jgi:hypothetical protein
MGVYLLKRGESLGVKSIATLLLPSFVVILGLAFLCLAPRAAAQAEDVAVVVSSSNPVTNISLVDLRKFFAGAKRYWPSGESIKLITRGPGCPEHLVLLSLLAMSESEYKHYWITQVFRGEADSEPLIVPSIGMQREALNVFPGGISLVNVRDVKPGMKVIKVNNLLPGAVGYPLH